MKNHVALLIAAGVLAGANVPQPARAQSAADVFRKYDLFGTWATNCAMPSSRENSYTVYRPLGADQVQREVRFGDGRATGIIDTAKEVKPNEILMSFMTSQISNRAISTVRIEGGRMRTYRSTSVAGELFVSDGRNTHTNVETEWVSKCKS